MGVIRIRKILRDEGIARRYFVINSFDGVLTMLGIIVSMYLTWRYDPNITISSKIIIVSSIGAAVALGVSGFWGAYVSERAERMRELNDLERHMLSDLRGTDIEKEMHYIIVLVALVDGISPFIVSLLLIAPFILFPLPDAFYVAIFAAGLILFILGAFIAKISNEGVVQSGLKMVAAGIVIGILLIALDKLAVL